MDLALAILVVTLLAYHGLEAHAWTKERAQLLNRIMARTYNEFVYSATATTAEAPIPISDEAWHQQNYAEHPELYPDGPDVAE